VIVNHSVGVAKGAGIAAQAMKIWCGANLPSGWQAWKCASAARLRGRRSGKVAPGSGGRGDGAPGPWSLEW